MQSKFRSTEGFTLAELMVAAAVLIIAFVGILISYIRCLELSEMARNSSIALSAAKTRVEQIKNENFSNVFANYNNVSFTSAGFDGIGVSYVDASNPELLQITVSFCWRQRNGRVIGEDANLDGTLNGGEDANGNAMIDSPVQLMTYIYDL